MIIRTLVSYTVTLISPSGQNDQKDHREASADVDAGFDWDSQAQFRRGVSNLRLHVSSHLYPCITYHVQFGNKKPQCSSCFLMPIQSDSIDGIFKTVTDAAKISQGAGGVGISVQHIRAAGSYIAGTNGTSNGLVPMLKVYNATAAYVDQGGGKRKGAFAIYVEPWHADIFDVLQVRRRRRLTCMYSTF